MGGAGQDGRDVVGRVGLTHHLLVAVDSRIPNLALMKVAAWAKARGDTAELGPGFSDKRPDEVWISCIFTWNRQTALEMGTFYPAPIKVHYGGTGFDWGVGDGIDFSGRITLPPDIESCDPDYSIYDAFFSRERWRNDEDRRKHKRTKGRYQRNDRAFGFCLRGCNRTCGFCDVWRKEGRIVPGSYKRIPEWVPDNMDKVGLLDNDMALYPNTIHDQIITDCASSGRKLSITQGYDIRCVTPERAQLLAEFKPWDLKFKEHRLYIAWDKLSSEKAIRRNIPILLDAGFKGREIFCYMVCAWEDYPSHGEDYFPRCDTFSQDMHRFKVLWEEFGVYPFVMIYNNRQDVPHVRAFARWVNRRVHKTTTWEEYARNPSLADEEEYDPEEQMTLA